MTAGTTTPRVSCDPSSMKQVCFPKGSRMSLPVCLGTIRHTGESTAVRTLGSRVARKQSPTGHRLARPWEIAVNAQTLQEDRAVNRSAWPILSKPGDGLWSLSRELRGGLASQGSPTFPAPRRLVEANALNSPGVLPVGQQLDGDLGKLLI